MNRSSQLKFCVDEPTEGQEFNSGEVWVRGWAIPVEGQISITARLQDMPWVEIPHGKTRTDVAIAYPEDRHSMQSGFGGRVPVSQTQPGEYDFTVQIRSGGETTEIRQKIRIGDPSRLVREAFLEFPDDFLRAKIDDPCESTVVLQGSVLKVTGWALAKTGIQNVEVQLDSGETHIAHFGLMREDIGALYEKTPGASHSGFLWVGHTRHLEGGRHTVNVRITSTAGHSAQMSTTFDVDPQTEYDYWSKLNKLDGESLLHLLEKSSRFSYRPKISIVTPVYKTPREFLIKCVESVKKQVYPNWELILVDDCSGDPRLTELLEAMAAQERRIRVISLASNSGIAGASNAGIALSTGDYVALLDHDDELAPDALFSVVEALEADRSTDVFYSDEDKIDENGRHYDPFFKPNWSPDLLRSMNYVCHFLVCRRSLLQSIGGFRLGFDGSQDFDLILRLSEHSQRIHRIPKILYHWRSHENSTAGKADQKPAASDAGKRALEEHLTRAGISARVEEIGTCRYRVKYKIIGEPEIAIIIPTGASPTLEAALKSVLINSTYRNYRIVIVDNSREGVRARVEPFRGSRHAIDLLDLRNLPFNFSLLCNRAARAVRSEYLVFLNDDTSIITPDWLESMLEHAQRPSVGAVGSLLLFPNGTIQHAGVVSGLLEVAGHGFRGLPDSPYYFALSHVIKNCSAVTGACLMTSRHAFEAVDGFDEPNLPTCFQDVDLCLKMVEKGFGVVYTPFAKLFHYESFSKKAVADLPELKYMKQRWKEYLKDDPYYNPNLTKSSEDYSIRYDRVFLKQKGSVLQQQSTSNPSAPVLPSLRTQAAQRRGRLGEIKFYATAKANSENAKGLSEATIVWDTAGAERVQVRVGSPFGNLFAQGGPSGSAKTGPWVTSGLVFYLIDATDGLAPSPEKVLSVLQM